MMSVKHSTEPGRGQVNLRFGLGVLMAAIAALGAGCSSGQPSFEPPIGWENAEFFDSVSSTIEADPATIQLEADGIARVTDYPVGSVAVVSNGLPCLDARLPQRFSGDGTWEVFSDQLILLDFGAESSILVTGAAKFQRQDWSEARIYTCGESANLWTLYLSCGEPGDNRDLSRRLCPTLP